MRAGELMRLLMLTEGPKWNLSNMKEMGGKNAVQGVKPDSPAAIPALQSSFIFNYANVLPSSLLSLGCRLDLVFVKIAVKRTTSMALCSSSPFPKEQRSGVFSTRWIVINPKVEGNKEWAYLIS